MELAKIRKEGNSYLVYFLELRRLLAINRTGAQIVGYFFNKNYSSDKIAFLLKKKSKDPSIISKKVIEEFLKKIKKELKDSRAGGYPIISQKEVGVPVSVELQINTNCNLRCRHCFQDEYHKIMPFEKIKKILTILHKVKVFEIKLVGGETFLHPRIFDVLHLCQKYNFVIDVVTNGTLLSDELIEKLVKIKNLALLVSLEGVEEINDRIRGKGGFEKVDKVIRKLREKGIYVEISTTLNSENIGHYREMVEYSKDLGVPCNLNLFKPLKKRHLALILKPEKYFEVAEEVFKDPESKSRVTSAAIVGEIVEHKERDECRATLLGLTIDVEGKMVPCPILQAAGYYDSAELPDFDKDFIDTWRNNQVFQEFRKIGFKECQARSYIFSKEVRGKDPYGITAFKKYCRSKK